MNALQLFQDITNYNFRFDICIKTYLACLDIIDFWIRNFPSNELMLKYGETIFEMLVQIEAKLQEDRPKYELYESELNDLFEKINQLNWI